MVAVVLGGEEQLGRGAAGQEESSRVATAGILHSRRKMLDTWLIAVVTYDVETCLRTEGVMVEMCLRT